MATNNKRIQVSELDFDAIKDNLKTFLRGQSEFSDYDFEGSGLSVLLDVLAYNTHYNALYTNLAVNEMFLDSASKRASVVSLAKMLGYIPRSAKCATVTVNATISSPTTSPDVVTLPANQPFTTSIDGESYTFYNRGAQTVARSTNGTYTFANLILTEGTPLQFKYTVAPGTRFIAPNANIDLNTVTVSVQETSSSDVFVNYTRAEKLTDVTSLTRVYFIKEIDDGLYEVQFGDGVIGQQLNNGNVVTIDYFVSSLQAPNTAFTFTYGGATLLGSNIAVTAISRASGGAESEDINSIKFNAPRLYAAQNRAVTPDDYKSIILSQFPEAQTVAVWGGEDNDPPIYGKTFISIKPTDASKLTQLQKDFVSGNILQARNVVSITPEIIDPEYFNVKVTTFVYYNPRDTTKTPTQIETIVKEAIIQYNEDDLEKFDGVLRYSKLTRIIDNSDPAIVNNITRIMVRRQFAPAFNISSEYKLNLINPISQDGGNQGNVFASTGFFIPNSTQVHFLDDDSLGNVRLYYSNPNFDKVVVDPAIGVIDYQAGRVTVRNLTITALDGPIFEMQVKPESYDVVSALNQIVQISSELLEVSAIADNTINGDLQAGFNYNFQSIRTGIGSANIRSTLPVLGNSGGTQQGGTQQGGNQQGGVGGYYGT